MNHIDDEGAWHLPGLNPWFPKQSLSFHCPGPRSRFREGWVRGFTEARCSFEKVITVAVQRCRGWSAIRLPDVRVRGCVRDTSRAKMTRLGRMLWFSAGVNRRQRLCTEPGDCILGGLGALGGWEPHLKLHARVWSPRMMGNVAWDGRRIALANGRRTGGCTAVAMDVRLENDELVAAVGDLGRSPTLIAACATVVRNSFPLHKAHHQ